MDSLVSIVVPVYQVEKYIVKCMLSICAQTYKNIEVILVDDGSPDHSIEYAVKVLEANTFNYRVISRDNIGPSCRNYGIDDAQGEYVVCIDSDDYVSQYFIETMVDALNNTGADIVIHNYKLVGEGYEDLKDSHSSTLDCFSKTEIRDIFLYRRKNIIVPAIMARKGFLTVHNIRYDENVRFTEDLLYIWQLIDNADTVAYINEPRYYYVSHSNSIMTSSDTKKIMTGYRGMLKYTENLSEDSVSQYIMPRWVFGMMHSSARIISYSAYKKMMQEIDYKHWLRNLKGYKDIRVVALAVMARCNLRLFYILAH